MTSCGDGVSTRSAASIETRDRAYIIATDGTGQSSSRRESQIEEGTERESRRHFNLNTFANCSETIESASLLCTTTTRGERVKMIEYKMRIKICSSVNREILSTLRFVHTRLTHMWPFSRCTCARVNFSLTDQLRLTRLFKLFTDACVMCEWLQQTTRAQSGGARP